jgi:hypothetical protein
MSIVTIRSHLGNRAPEIGKLVADKLHTDYIDREIIAEVAGWLNSRQRSPYRQFRCQESAYIIKRRRVKNIAK